MGSNVVNSAEGTHGLAWPIDMPRGLYAILKGHPKITCPLFNVCEFLIRSSYKRVPAQKRKNKHVRPSKGNLYCIVDVYF